MKLAPGATDHAVLQIVDVSNVPAANCKPLTPAEAKVYPTDDVTAAYVPWVWHLLGGGPGTPVGSPTQGTPKSRFASSSIRSSRV